MLNPASYQLQLCPTLYNAYGVAFFNLMPTSGGSFMFKIMFHSLGVTIWDHSPYDTGVVVPAAMDVITSGGFGVEMRRYDSNGMTHLVSSHPLVTDQLVDSAVNNLMSIFSLWTSASWTWDSNSLNEMDQASVQNEIYNCATSNVLQAHWMYAAHFEMSPAYAELNAVQLEIADYNRHLGLDFELAAALADLDAAVTARNQLSSELSQALTTLADADAALTLAQQSVVALTADVARLTSEADAAVVQRDAAIALRDTSISQLAAAEAELSTSVDNLTAALATIEQLRAEPPRGAASVNIASLLAQYAFAAMLGRAVVHKEMERASAASPIAPEQSVATEGAALAIAEDDE